MSIKSPFADVTIPDVSLTDFVFANTRTDKVAFVDGPSGRQMTANEVYSKIQLMAGTLQARGFGPGQVLAIMLPNLPEYAILFHAAAFCGGTVTTINPTYKAAELRHQLHDADARLLVTIGMFLDNAKEATSESAIDVYTVDSADGSKPFAELFAGPALQEQVQVDYADHVVVIPYSSGTTGLSKGVMLTHRNLIANILQIFASGLTFHDDTAYCCVLPYFHIYGMIVLMNCGLYTGAKQITMPRFDLPQFLQLNQEHKCDWMFIVPPIVIALANHPIVEKYRLETKVIFSGAAPLGAEIAQKAAKRLGAEVRQGYGMTELSPVSHLFPEDGKTKAGSIGVAVANCECRIVDENGKDAPRGERGELWIKGPNVMKGYLNNEEATTHTIDADKYLHTGDVAIVDEDGYFFIVDRLKELIKVKGFQVPPAELEALLLTHESIVDCCVIGVPDDEAGELPKAFVVKRANAQLSTEQVQDFVKGKVATYKQIKFIEFVDKIQKSASGKILRRLYRDQAIAQTK